MSKDLDVQSDSVPRQHVFIVGAKGLANYGGFETFVDKLVECHQDDQDIQYHVACKANGIASMDESKLDGAQVINDHEFMYHNAHCFKVHVSDKIGSAQAITYDMKALDYCIDYVREHQINHPIVYILACRIGPVMGHYRKKLKKLGFTIYLNPDGHEWARAKWNAVVRKYWKVSEGLMVKNADLAICDSVTIEQYIQTEYAKYHPNTTYISYGSVIAPSPLSDDDPKFTGWLAEHNLAVKEYYLIVGRFVPENSFETIIKEFMNSKSEKSLAIITTADERFMSELQERLQFQNDPRINFVGTVYDQPLLKKIREQAYGYIHGHTVGGTNPSLLEALGSTDLNLLINVGFNKEVGKDAALYWSAHPGSLSALIDQCDGLDAETIQDYADKAKQRIRDAYSWAFIADEYAKVFKK